MSKDEFTETQKVDIRDLLRLRRGRNGNGDRGNDMTKFITVLIAVLAALGTGIGSWVANAERISKTETEVAQIKERAQEDRQEAKSDRQEIKRTSGQTAQGVQQILIKLERFEEQERARERARSKAATDAARRLMLPGISE